TYLRPLGLSNDEMAELEMSAFLDRTNFTREDCDEVVVGARERAMKNPRASYGALLRSQSSSSSPPRRGFSSFDRAQFAEAGMVLVLASDDWIRRNGRRDDAVYVDGVAWRSSLPWYE